MLRDEHCWKTFKYWLKTKPEEELYLRVKEQPTWPFKEISEGYFYVAFTSDRAYYGMGLFLLALVFLITMMATIGLFSVATGTFIIIFGVAWWTIHGKLSRRELYVSRIGKGGYTLRLAQNEETLVQGELRNVYIRLMKKIDALGEPMFCLILGGYNLDDNRLTHMTVAENPLRLMGMKIALRIGINFFDWKDESEDHVILHYKTYSRVKKYTNITVTPTGDRMPSPSGYNATDDPRRKSVIKWAPK